MMTKERKRLQDKLRRKYRWSTNTNYNRGSMLIKPEASAHMYHEPKYVTDLAIYMGDREIRNELLGVTDRGLEIRLSRYDYDHGEYKLADEMVGYLTLKELEFIYRIAQERIQEVCDDMNHFNEEKEN